MFLALFFATHINIFTSDILKDFKIFLYDTEHSATIKYTISVWQLKSLYIYT